MTGQERRQIILSTLLEDRSPITGTELSKQFGVSRQIIVQDIALLRAASNDIIATTKGYILKR